MADASVPIEVESSRCNGCGVCTRICHEQAMTVQHGKVTINAALCSTCSQCIAICPERALSWRGVAASLRAQQRVPTPQQLDEMFKERRSVRAYTPERLARDELEAIATSAAYAPTNNYDFRLVIVDDPALLAALESLAHRMVRGVYQASRAACRALPSFSSGAIRMRVKCSGCIGTNAFMGHSRSAKRRCSSQTMWKASACRSSGTARLAQGAARENRGKRVVDVARVDHSSGAQELDK